jgi:hypothetical protein
MQRPPPDLAAAWAVPGHISTSPARQLTAGGRTRPHSGPAATVGDPDRRDQRAVAVDGRREELRFDVGEHRLGPPGPGERAVGAHVAPCQVQKPIAPPTVDGRATYVHPAVVDDDRAHLAIGSE